MSENYAYTEIAIHAEVRILLQTVRFYISFQPFSKTKFSNTMQCKGDVVLRSSQCSLDIMFYLEELEIYITVTRRMHHINNNKI